VFYVSCVGARYEFVKAVGLCRMAANAGHAGAQNNLVFRYRRGTGVEKDASKGV
jgi:TPR repeat protein